MLVREAAIRLIYPVKCIVCKKVLPYESDDFICEKCKDTFKKIEGRVCDICGRPVVYPGLCRDCNSTKLYFDRAYSVFYYQDEMRKAIHAFKYGDKGSNYLYFARAMADYANLNAVPYVDYVVPIPIHFIREHFRGFNQANLLAKEYARIRRERIYPLLKRARYTKPQSMLTIKQRQNNIRDAFILNPVKEDIKGKTVLLIDDIYTTGSTANECARILKKAGIDKVYVLCLSARILD